MDKRETNKMCFAGCITSLVGITLMNPLGLCGLVGTILSIIGLSQLYEGERGKPLAILGIVVGIIATIWYIISFAFI